MKSLSRVVWSEGMHLAQHHFQAQSRYFEELTAFSVSNLFHRSFGLVGCELDAEALLNGTVSLKHARGLMPDGLPFHFPDDPVPEPLEIRDRFSPTHDTHLVLLGVARYRPGQANCAPAANGGRGPDARYVAITAEIPDETTGIDEKPVALARNNFRLLLDTDAADELVTLPLARVRRDGSGHFVYDPEYVPPCVQIGASRRLLEILGRLLEMLDAKAEAMMQERRGSSGSLAEYASREVASFWLSHAIHSSLAPLRHFFQTRSGHPEQLFAELARLGGALSTFSLHSHPRDLPLYDHDNPDRCFGALDRHIREHLDIVVPTNCVHVPLEATDQFLYTGAIADRRCFGRAAHWFLGVRSSAGAGEIIARVPKLVKVCSAKHIVRLVREAYPGLPLEHTTSPPSDVSPRLGTQYFAIQKVDPCWKSIVETAMVGVYAPAGIADAELQLAIVLENG